MKWIIAADYEELSAIAAGMLLDQIHTRPDSVLGLPTGRTPEGMYARVASECRTGTHCFTEVKTFNLDEYVGLSPHHPSSYCTYMRKHLFDHVDLRAENINVPDGSAAKIFGANAGITTEEALELECRRYEEAIAKAGGLDRTFLGLGSNGHIGFNEPGTPFSSRTRVVTLAESTRRANAKYFESGRTPEKAITMGIATILESQAIVLLASGETKRPAVVRLRSGEVDPTFPASALHEHDDVTVVIDRAAAGE